MPSASLCLSACTGQDRPNPRGINSLSFLILKASNVNAKLILKLKPKYKQKVPKVPPFTEKQTDKKWTKLNTCTETGKLKAKPHSRAWHLSHLSGFHPVLLSPTPIQVPSQGKATWPYLCEFSSGMPELAPENRSQLASS